MFKITVIEWNKADDINLYSICKTYIFYHVTRFNTVNVACIYMLRQLRKTNTLHTLILYK